MRWKNILTILWTVGLLAFLIWFFSNAFGKPDRKAAIVNAKLDRALIDSLLHEHDHIVLVVGVSDCPPCQEVVPQLALLHQYDICPYFLLTDADDYNLSVAQALRNKSHPTSYLIGKGGDIVAIIRGAIDYYKRVKDAITGKRTDNDASEQNELAMLNYSFKGFLCLADGDTEQGVANLRKSFEYGSYFYSNYLISGVVGPDSTGYYIDRAMKCLVGSDWYLYGNIIEKLSLKPDENDQ